MKNIIIITLLISSLWSCKAQTNVINYTDWCNNQTDETNGSLYLKDINNLYLPFVGTWKWTQGNKEFTLTLIKQTSYHNTLGNSDYYEDRIVGYYVYKENGVEIINTSNDNLNDYLPKVEYSLDCGSNVGGNIKDVAKNKYYRTLIEIISPTQMQFNAKEDTHIRRVKEGVPQETVYAGNSFPMQMTLNKQ